MTLGAYDLALIYASLGYTAESMMAAAKSLVDAGNDDRARELVREAVAMTVLKDNILAPEPRDFGLEFYNLDTTRPN